MLAELLHKTVAELLDGKPAPLSGEEFAHWVAFLQVKAEMAKEA